MNFFKKYFFKVLFFYLFTTLLQSCVTTISYRPKHIARTIFNVSPKSDAPGTYAFEKRMSLLTNSKLVEGNTAVPLFNGEEVFPKMLDLIQRAENRICFETYIFREDQTGSFFKKAILTKKESSSCSIYLMSDDVGNNASTRKTLAPLKLAGVETKVFNPLMSWTFLRGNQRNHRKILSIDGKEAILGGLNIGNEYTGDGSNGFRDTGLYVRGPIVNEIEKSFLKVWQQGGYGYLQKDLPIIGINRLKRNFDNGLLSLFGQYHNMTFPPSEYKELGFAKARIVTSEPDNFSSYLLDMYLLAINSAKTKVYITTSYFVPPLLLLKALKNAAKRGVDVKILLQGKTDQNFIRQYAINKYGQLLKSGVLIYEWPNSILHAKTIVVDDIWCSIGSCNLDGRSFFLNYEANVAITDKKFAFQMETQFIKDLGQAEKISYYIWKRRPWYKKILGTILWPIKGQF